MKDYSNKNYDKYLRSQCVYPSIIGLIALKMTATTTYVIIIVIIAIAVTNTIVFGFSISNFLSFDFLGKTVSCSSATEKIDNGKIAIIAITNRPLMA